MTDELEKMVAKTENREGLARLFSRIAETIAAPLEFKRDDEATFVAMEGIDEGGADG